MLDKCDGPACPRCGCQDSEVRALPPAVNPELVAQFGVSSWFAAGRARCKNCGLAFSFRELPAADEPAEETPGDEEPPFPTAVQPEGRIASPVFYPIRRCPECASEQVKVTSTRRPLRHHKCAGCGAKFKSIEKEPRP